MYDCASLADGTLKRRDFISDSIRSGTSRRLLMALVTLGETVDPEIAANKAAPRAYTSSLADVVEEALAGTCSSDAPPNEFIKIVSGEMAP
jgi:hypothetical protein